MSKINIANYLKQTHNSLGRLLFKVNQLTQWNNGLAECLSEEKKLLEHCKIVTLDKAALIVIADTANWATRFRFYIPMLLQKLKKYPGLEGIQAICCKIRPATTYTSPLSTSQKSSPRRLTLSSQSAKMIYDIAQEIKDEKLKKILEKLASEANT